MIIGTLIANGVAPNPKGKGRKLPATTSTVSNSQAIDDAFNPLERELNKLKVRR
jgi:ribosome-associated translation inhibitor RaiA